MHDDFLEDLAAFRTLPAPEAGAELRALFAAVPSASNVAATPAAAAQPARRVPVYKRILTGVPSKIAAGALGALLAGSVGAGALTGTMVLTSNEEEAPVVVDAVDEDAVVASEEEEAEAEEVELDEPKVEDVSLEDDAEGDADAGKHEVPEDLSTVAVPTSVSEAAQNHAFDEACGNHGMYVSHFAQTGEEPDCATEARAAAAAAGEGSEVESSDVSAEVVESGDDGDKAEAKAARTEARKDRQAAKAASKGGAKSNRSGKGSR